MTTVQGFKRYFNRVLSSQKLYLLFSAHPMKKNSLSAVVLGFERMTCLAVLPRKEQKSILHERERARACEDHYQGNVSQWIVCMIKLCQRWDRRCQSRMQSSLCFQFALICCTLYKYVRWHTVKEGFTKKSLFRHQSYLLRDCLGTDQNPIGQIGLYIIPVNRRLIV